MGVLRVIVFNADESFGPTLRAALTSFDFVRIVAEVDDAALLPTAAQQFSAEIMIVNLDPYPEAVLAMAGEVVSSNPNLAVFALSESTDGKLILSVMRQGFREFIPKPIERESLEEAFSKVAIQTSGRAPTGRLVMVMGTVGGCGATSLAVNLGAEMAGLSEGRVSVVDLDYRFGQVATMLDVAPTYTIADLAQSPEQLEQQVIERALIRHETGVHVLARPASWTQSDNMTAATCVGVLTSLLNMNAYVVADGPNRYDTGAAAILDVADLTLMVIQLTVPSVRNAQRILQGMQEAGYNLDRTKLVCNRVGKDTGSLAISDVESTLNKPVFASLPDEWAAMNACVNLGEALCVRSPKSKVRLAIKELAEKIHTPDGGGSEEEAAKKGNGILGKIFSEA